MNADQFGRVIRRPRHEAVEGTSCRTWLELSEREPRAERAVKLVNVSRHGLQLASGEPLAPAERVVVHIEGEAAKPDISLSATVRWQRLGNNGTWSVGCAFEQPIGYEVMGELFLSGILDMNSTNA